MVDRLGPVNAGLLQLEDADQHTSLGMGALAVLDGPMPPQPVLVEALGDRIGACPRFAQRLRRRVLDLGAPEWVDDGRFELSHHVRRIAVPAGAGDDGLFRLVADVMSWPLDRNRPLWEIWLIDGLPDDRWAMLVKVHPCLADAVATVHILTGLADDAAADSHRPARPLRPAAEPGGAGGWSGLGRGAAALAGGVLAGMANTERALRGAGQLLAGLRQAASPLTGPITSRRRYAAARVDRADVDLVCATFGVGVEDVALAAITEGYRQMLMHRGDAPRADSLRTLIPTGDAVLLAQLPVEEENPVLRLRMVHARMARLRATAPDSPAGAMAALAGAVPFALTAWAANLLARLPHRGLAALAVHVPGPERPLTVLGCPVAQVWPIPPIGMRLRTGAAVLGYADSLFFGVLADFHTVPDTAELAAGIEAAVARLVTRSKRRRSGRDRHGLSLVVSA